MFPFFSAQLRHWALPLLVCSVLIFQFQSPPANVEESCDHDTVSTSDAQDLERLCEAQLEEKGRSVLRSLGEVEPLIVVTTSFDRSKSQREEFLPSQDHQVLESSQQVSESLQKDSDREGYEQAKVSTNYQVGCLKTISSNKSPRLQSVSCLATVSSRNSERTEEIEKALYVALGLQADRGDTVMVMAR